MSKLRRLKRVGVLVLLLLVGVVSVYAKEAPKISISQDYLDFGQLEQDILITKTLSIKNIGNETLIIKGIYTECECVKGKILSKEVAPGSSTELKISYDTKDKEKGPDTKDVFIFSNDPNNPKMKITVKAMIVEKINTEALTSKKENIYSKLKCCACGKPFTTCVCHHAKLMKTDIDNFLKTGLSQEDVFLKLAKKYSLDLIIDKKVKKEVEKRLIQEAGSSRPQIFIQPISYDLGRLKKSRGKFTLKVKIQNKGSNPLEINGLKPSCVCVTIKLKNKGKKSPVFGQAGSPSGWNTIIASGKTAELTIILDLSHPSVHIGKLIRSVEVRSNDPVYPVVQIELEAEIIE